VPEFDLVRIVGGNARTDLRCTSCELCDNPDLRTNLMRGSGPQDPFLFFCGFAPGAEDDEIGSSFTGANGRIFRGLLSASSIDVQDCYLTNCVKCSPFGADPKDSWWKRCKGHLAKEIRDIRPKAIVAMGGKALHWLTGFSGVDRFRRVGLPCTLDPKIPVYAFEQPLSLMHADPDEYDSIRARMVSDLIWLREKAIARDLRVGDEIKTDYQRANTVEDVKRFLDEFPEGSTICFDFETGTADLEKTTFPHPGTRLVLLCFSAGPGHARMIPYEARGISSLTYWSDDELRQIHALFAEFWPKHTFFGQNAVQFDERWRKAYWPGETLKLDFDTMYAAHLIRSDVGCSGLRYLAGRYTTIPPWKDMFNLRDTRKLCEYGAYDVDATWRVRLKLEPELNEAQQWLHHELQLPLGHEFRRMETRGLRLNTEALLELGSVLEGMLEEAEKEIRTLPQVQSWEFKNNKSLSFDAPHQIADLMQNYFHLPKIKETGTGGYCTDKDVLEHYEEEPFCFWLLRLRRVGKLYKTYYGSLTKASELSEFVHTSIRMNGTVTGRPSSSDPNLLNQVRKDTVERAGLEDGRILKACFVPRDGYVYVQVDYSQAELRTLAMLSGDVNLIQIYMDGLDVHTATAARVYGCSLEEVTKAQRSRAKAVNFGIIYGKSEQSLINDFVKEARSKARKLKLSQRKMLEMEREAEEAALDFLSAHKQAHPQVWAWMRQQIAIITEHGYQETEFGRRRYYPRINNEAKRAALNFPVQSTASDFTLFAIVRLGRIVRELGFDAHMVLTVYDSILWEVKPSDLFKLCGVCRDVMENLGFSFMGEVPLTVDFEVGKSWGNLRELDIDGRRVKTSKGEWRQLA